MPLLPGAGLAVATAALGLVLAVGLPGSLRPGERFVIGLVTAVVAVALAGYGLALLIGMHPGLIALLLVMVLASAGIVLVTRSPRVVMNEAGTSGLAELQVREGWKLLAVLVVLGGALAFLFERAVDVEPEGWITHYVSTWADWSSHASYATTFVFGQNLPPENPLFAGRPLRYPFAPDFASALLVLGGWTLPAALVWPAWLMATLALSGLVLWARRLTGALAPGVVAVTLTLLGGGLGFWFFFGDAARLGAGSVIAHLPRGYDRFDPPVNIQWSNPILSYYLPQRNFVFGAAILIAVLLLLTPVLQASRVFDWRATLQSLARVRSGLTPSSGVVLFVLAGALTGALPWFHVHSLLVLGIVTLCWALLFPRPAWLAFFVVAVLLAMPRLLMAVPGDASAPVQLHYPRLQAGWLAGPDNPVWFWIKNTGLFWPLLLVALLTPLALRGRTRLILVPFVAVFAVANIVIFQPWDWDNTKVLIFWYLASAVAVSALLARIWRAGWFGRLGALIAWLSLVASGVLSLLQFVPPQGPSYVWFTREELGLADQIRRLTPPHAIFLTGDRPNNPVADLAGRPVLMSYRGWLWTYGIDYRSRETDIARIYAGDPAALDLLHRYHVDFVVVGPDELTNWHADTKFFGERLRPWAQTANYQVYAVPAE